MKAVACLLLFGFGVLLGYGWRGPGKTPGIEESSRPSKSTKRVRPHAAPDEIEALLGPIRDAGDRAARIRAVVHLATRLPVEDFERWYRGNYLEFLDLQLEGIFYSITKERWLEADPGWYTRYAVERKQRGLAESFARWLEVSEDEAIDYVRSLPVADSSRAVVGLVLAVGKKDVAKSLGLLEEFENRWGTAKHMLRDPLVTLAAGDREAVLAYVADWSGDARSVALSSVAAAWLEKDLGWVVEMLNREGLEWRGLKMIVNHTKGDPGPAFLANIGELPEEWVDQLIKSHCSSLVWGNSADWLELRSHDDLSEDHLKGIQLLAAGRWWSNEKRRKGMELLEHGTWLSDDVRAKLAQSVVGAWDDDLDAVRTWAASLSDELRVTAEEALTNKERQLKTQAHMDRLKDPNQTLQILAESDQYLSTHGLANKWDDAAMAQVVRAVDRLTPEQVSKIHARGAYSDGLPPEVVARLAVRLWEEHPPGDGARELSKTKRRMEGAAQRWAHQSPAAAGDWVLSLPAGEVRLATALKVAGQWANYSPSEVRSWAERLEANERAAVLESLE